MPYPLTFSASLHIGPYCQPCDRGRCGISELLDTSADTRAASCRTSVGMCCRVPGDLRLWPRDEVMCDVLPVKQFQRHERAVRRWRARPESWWWISAVVVLPVLVLTGISVLVLLATTHPGSATERIDLVKTALSVGAGTGGVVALVLAGRRQWHNEEAQRATEKSHRAGEHDATERRITDLYGKAVEQLGSDKAPVRLGGLYALERLAQDNPGQRQTIVDVLCAYLRMPYVLPGDPPAEDAGEATMQRFDARAQERQVRITAQRILTRHLEPGVEPGRPSITFWSDTDIDLTGAILVDFSLHGCRLQTARFMSARFIGAALFNDAQFVGDAGFQGVQFDSAASFNGAQFDGVAYFNGSSFADVAWFGGVQFGASALFNGVGFIGAAEFTETRFAEVAFFNRARFGNAALFDKTEFVGDAKFEDVQFGHEVSFTPTGEMHLPSRCWMRVDVADAVANRRTWPRGWMAQPATERPSAEAEGKWAWLAAEGSPPVAF